MKISLNTSKNLQGFSLAEMLAALTIGVMILVAVLGIYIRAERSASAIGRRFDSSRLPGEILQRIAEDLDRTISVGSNAKVTIENKFQNGLPSARLTIRKTIRDSKDQEHVFEEIIWQSSADVDSNSLVLYRSHSGMVLEDRLLDEKRARWEKDYSFVPICAGVTFFKIQVPQGEAFQDSWTSDAMPVGIVATISFARPFGTVAGTFDVPDEEKVARTIAIDRTRKIGFVVIPIEEEKKGDEQLSGISK
jgi:hypothetical protein